MDRFPKMCVHTHTHTQTWILLIEFTYEICTLYTHTRLRAFSGIEFEMVVVCHAMMTQSRSLLMNFCWYIVWMWVWWMYSHTGHGGLSKLVNIPGVVCMGSHTNTYTHSSLTVYVPMECVCVCVLRVRLAVAEPRELAHQSAQMRVSSRPSSSRWSRSREAVREFLLNGIFMSIRANKQSHEHSTNWARFGVWHECWNLGIGMIL